MSYTFTIYCHKIKILIYPAKTKTKKKCLTCPNPLKNLNLEQPTLNVEIQRKKDFHEYTNVHLSGVKTE